MSLVFFFLRNVPISGLGLPRVGEEEEGEEGEEGEEEDNVGGGPPLSADSEKGKKILHTILTYIRK
jgi:hypothetical protein